MGDQSTLRNVCWLYRLNVSSTVPNRRRRDQIDVEGTKSTLKGPDRRRWDQIDAEVTGTTLFSPVGRKPPLAAAPMRVWLAMTAWQQNRALAAASKLPLTGMTAG